MPPIVKGHTACSGRDFAKIVKCGIREYATLTFGSFAFCDITLYSTLNINRHFEGKLPPSSGPKSESSNKSQKLITCFMLVSCLPYSSILKTKAIFPSEMLVASQQYTWRDVPEHRTISCSQTYNRELWPDCFFCVIDWFPVIGLLERVLNTMDMANVLG
jgi:hypothetical protein